MHKFNVRAYVWTFNMVVGRVNVSKFHTLKHSQSRIPVWTNFFVSFRSYVLHMCCMYMYRQTYAYERVSYCMSWHMPTMRTNLLDSHTHARIIQAYETHSNIVSNTIQSRQSLDESQNRIGFINDMCVCVGIHRIRTRTQIQMHSHH